MQACIHQPITALQNQSHGARFLQGENSSSSEDEPPPSVGSGLVSSELLARALREEPNCNNVVAPKRSGHNPYYCLHPNVEMKKNHLGKGLYAKALIHEGEVVYDATKSTTLARVDAKTMQTWPAEQFDFFEKYSWQVGHDMWSGPSCKEDLKNDYVNYVNHSCDPTVWFAGEETLVARRDIQPGEEISFDYATSETAISTFLIQGCLCGSPKCRKRVSPWDYKLPSLQAKYGEHFMPYILEQIAAEPKLQLGSGMYKSLHQYTELRLSKSGGFRGCGLFATDFIPKGAIVWCGENDNDALATAEEFGSFSKDKKEWFLNFSHQVDKDTISSVRALEDLEKDASHFMNHSCDPTLWFVGDQLLEARRDIYPGEELTYDYGTNDSLFERIHECKCGAPECRRRITPTDYLLPHMQERYRHHFSLYLLAELFNTQGKVAADMVEGL